MVADLREECGGFIHSRQWYCPRTQLQTPGEMGWLELLKIFFWLLPFFQWRKKIGYQLIMRIGKTCCKCEERGENQECEKEEINQENTLFINGQHEEPLSSVVLYLKWDQQDSFILFCCFLCLLQWLSGHRVYRVGFDQCFSFTKWEKKSKKVKGLLYAASFRSLLLVMIF